MCIEKPKIKRLKSVDLLAQQPFYDQLNIMKKDQAFKGYAVSYKVEIVEKKNLIAQVLRICLIICLMKQKALNITLL